MIFSRMLAGVVQSSRRKTRNPRLNHDEKRCFRITSYNVCYTKLLRTAETMFPKLASLGAQALTEALGRQFGAQVGLGRAKRR